MFSLCTISPQLCIQLHLEAFHRGSYIDSTNRIERLIVGYWKEIRHHYIFSDNATNWRKRRNKKWAKTQHVMFSYSDLWRDTIFCGSFVIWITIKESHEIIRSKAAVCEKEGKAENNFCLFLRIEIIILLVGSPNRYRRNELYSASVKNSPKSSSDWYTTEIYVET